MKPLFRSYKLVYNYKKVWYDVGSDNSTVIEGHREVTDRVSNQIPFPLRVQWQIQKDSR